MKKGIAILLAVVLVLSLAACGSKPDDVIGGADGPTDINVTDQPHEDVDLMAMMEAVNEGAADVFSAVETVELTEETFEAMAFIPWIDGMRAVLSQPMMAPPAHRVILVQVPEGTDASTVAADIEANANPAWLVCVEAEKTIVEVKGDVILFVMSDAAIADAMLENFQNF